SHGIRRHLVSCPSPWRLWRWFRRGLTREIASDACHQQGVKVIYYAVAGFAVVAATVLGRRFAFAWRRESARIDQLIADFDAEKAAEKAELQEESQPAR